MNDLPETKSYAESVRGRRTAAVVLLVVAGAALAGPYVPFNWRDGFLLLMGVGFMVWSALARSPGLLVPGCMLVGVGSGILLRGEYGGGAFLLAMSGGFLLLAGLSRVMFPEHKGSRWPLWPAAGLAFAGLMASAGPDARELFRLVRPYWPHALIIVAVFLLLAKPAPRA
jgi:hypothetical protein